MQPTSRRGFLCTHPALSSYTGLILTLLIAPNAVCSTNALSPADELASFHFADDQLRIELIAAEPDVISPVAVAWDAHGRLYVAEMSDYPNARGGGRIKLIEGANGSGNPLRVTVFAAGLPFPNGVLPWKDGVLVTAAPDILYLKDNDGDGRADERRVLFTGFGQGNQQLRVNGLFWGLDNWIYGANGRSDGEVRPAGQPEAAAVSLRGHDFRFRPGTRVFEAIAGRCQFGQGQDDWGNRFLSWNTIPIRHEVLPERYLVRNPRLAATESIQDLLEPGDSGRVYPLTPPPLTFNSESTSHFNALAGLHLFRGDALGPAYAGNAFVGESLRNLVHRRVLETAGPTFLARRGEREHEREFLASTDPWFHPVNFATGPEGALYVVDFYRRFVEHPDFVHSQARDEVPWRTGAEHGRLWRIRRNDGAGRSQPVALAQAPAATLVEGLERTNGWWRDTCQRLLVERQDRIIVPALERLVRRAPRPESRVQALHVLDGLGALTEDSLRAALRDSHPLVRADAVRTASSGSSTGPGLQKALLKLERDPDSRVRYQLALALGNSTADGRAQALARLAEQDATNRWAALALLSSAGDCAPAFWQHLLEPRWRTSPAPAEAVFVEQLTRLIGASGNIADTRQALDELGRTSNRSRASLFVLAGLATGLAPTAHPLRQLMNDGSELSASQRAVVAQGSEQAAAVARDRRALVTDRLAAVRLLKHTGPDPVKGLAELLDPSQPVELQLAAARALGDSADGALFRTVLARWSEYSRATRRELSAAAARSPAARSELIQALQTGGIQPVELDAPARQALLRSSDAATRLLVEKIFNQGTAPERADVVRQFQPALQLAGDRSRGAAVFARSCLQCHALEGQGQAVGPDLMGIGSRPKDALLVDIVDPNRQVSADFVSYAVLTSKGETVSGLIVAETASSVTLRRTGQADETVLREQIKEWRAEGKSLMPEGLEQGWSAQDMADLLEFLAQPEARLLPK